MNRYSPSRTEKLFSQVSRLRDLPTLSVVVSRVMLSFDDTNFSRGQLAELLKKDQVLTARILRLVNSGFYARSQEVTDVKRALHFLGDHTVMALVMGTSVFSDKDFEASYWFDVQDFWLHSLATAIASEFISLHLKFENIDECFTCGLLHDIGKMALFRADPETLEEIVMKCRAEGLSFIEAEQSLGLPGHHLVGERMAIQWNLPLVVRKAIRYHHRDVSNFESILPEHRKAITLVMLADTIAKRCGLGFSGDVSVPEYSTQALEFLGLKSVFLEELEERLPAETFSAREMLIARSLERKAA